VSRRFPNAKVRIALVAALALVVVVTLTLSVRHYRQPVAAPPEALAHIAEKNRDAAAVAAARQRAESAAATNAVENIAEAQRRGEAEANAMLDRFPNSDDRTNAQVRRD
jgi:flagellar biosynthesis/type III secretory pathway M-ring protein FliF/YscJ